MKKFYFLFTFLFFIAFIACKQKQAENTQLEKELTSQSDFVFPVPPTFYEQAIELTNLVGLDTSNVWLAQDLGSHSIQYLTIGSKPKLTLVLGDLNMITDETKQGIRPILTTVEIDGPGQMPIIFMPIITNKIIRQAVFYHNYQYVLQPREMDVTMRQLNAYQKEKEWLVTHDDGFNSKFAEAKRLYNTSNISSTLFEYCMMIYPKATQLEKNLIGPGIMTMVAIDAGENTPQKLEQFFEKLRDFFDKKNQQITM